MSRGWRGLLHERGKERPQLRRAVVDRSPEIGSRDGQLGCLQSSFQGSQQPALARDHRPFRPDDGQGQELAIVARQPWQHTRSQERRLTSA
jgi:hypothetical protein